MYRLVRIFFYGVFIDAELLREKNAHPTAIRRATVLGAALRIGRRAALAPETDGVVLGMLMELPHHEIDALYRDPSLSDYRPEPVLAICSDNEAVAALCFNLPVPPVPDERNEEYAAKLREVAQRLSFPAEYVRNI